MLTKEEIREVVDKLIGDVEAIGESRHDEKAYDNLVTMTYVCDALIDEIRRSSETKYNPQYSMKRVGEHAHSYLKDLADWLEEILGETE